MKDSNLKFWTTNPNAFLVAIAEESKKVVGCISYREISPNTVEMHRCSVDSNCRGLGIGKKLVQALEKKAIENGYEHMYLETSTPQVGAWKMYEKCGFQFLRYMSTEMPLIDHLTGIQVVAYTKQL